MSKPSSATATVTTATTQQEDGLLQFCYETEINLASTYEQLVSRVRWNYEARFDKRPADGCPVSVCGPFGDRGYIEPFLDFSAYYQQQAEPTSAPSASASTTSPAAPTERVFAVPRRSVFTRYFSPSSHYGQSSRAKTYLQYGSFSKPASTDGGGPGASSVDAATSSWLDSVVDTVLLELEDLLDEMNLYCESVPNATSKAPNSSGRHGESGCRTLAPSGSIELLDEVAVQSLKARLSDEQFFECSKLKRTSIKVTGQGLGYHPQQESGDYVDYDHLPWPWLSLPPSNSMRFGLSSHWEVGKRRVDKEEWSIAAAELTSSASGTHHVWSFCDVKLMSDGGGGLLAKESFDSGFSSSSSTLRSSLSAFSSSPECGSLSPVPTSPRERKSMASTIQDSGLVNLCLEARPIPVLAPLGVHRAEGGERILSGAGVDHMNLIQLVGNPAHGLQPKLVQSWRNPAYVQWISQWDVLSINYGLL